MPDASTLEAARPKCPAGPGQTPRAKEPCGRPLRYDVASHFWRCPEHGRVLTPESLIHRQGVAVGA